jgi:hypothetical protein
MEPDVHKGITVSTSTKINTPDDQIIIRVADSGDYLQRGVFTLQM